MKKVLIIAQGIDGGVAQVSSLLARSLPRDQWAVRIIYVGRPCEATLAKGDSADGIESRAISTGTARTWREVAAVPRSMIEIAKECDAFAPDIIISSGLVPTLLFSKILKAKTKKPVLFWDHGPAYSFRAIKHAMFHMTSRNIDFIASVATFSKEYFIDTLKWPEHKIQVIQNAVGRNFLPPEGEPPSLDQLRVIMAARLDLVQKDPLTLIRATRLVLNQGIDIHLALAGSGAAKNEIEQVIAAEGLSDHVELLGHVGDMSTVLGQYNVTCLSTRFESFGLCLVEGMLAGHVVLGSAVCGVTDVIRNGENGFLFAAEDPEDLAKTLISVHRDQANARALAQVGQSEAAVRYTPDRITREFSDLCHRLIAAG